MLFPSQLATIMVIQEEKEMPLILWLLGVPLSLVIVLMLFHVV